MLESSESELVLVASTIKKVDVEKKFLISYSSTMIWDWKGSPYCHSIWLRIKILDFFGEISSIYRILVVLNTILGTDYRSMGISAKYRQYRFGGEKSTKKSSVERHAKQWRKSVKISKIYRQYIEHRSTIYQTYRRLFVNLPHQTKTKLDISLIYRGNIRDFF